ncbi:alpha/beta hydrolase [Iamia majanohamensis]|uniref:Alpha/beta hydrolase n=1 Tax=Iamia majanohamensis TaxID=467976 RepID=A0AAF0BVZ9_9ACTN|nr:alpha/beta hydrolase [Iamia majanohamensis]WCO67285.1 alpha/beta hydrolase [Iamia majanohamensis]
MTTTATPTIPAEHLLGTGSTTVEAADDTRLHVWDWGSGRPVVLSHAWGLSGRMWDAQLATLLDAGLRVVVPDRRGHGLSAVPGQGYGLDVLADDLAAVLDQRDLRDAVLVGHSAGAQEALRCITRHGVDRVAGIVLSAPVTPGLLPDEGGAEVAAAFSALRASWRTGFARWVLDGADAYFGAAEVAAATRDATVAQLLATPLPVVLATHRTLTTADLRPDLAALSLPTTVVQGSVDASAPIEVTGEPTAALVEGSVLVRVEGGGHGLYAGHAEEYGAALLDAVRRAA